jgi:hypothetical protein
MTTVLYTARLLKFAGQLGVISCSCATKEARLSATAASPDRVAARLLMCYSDAISV